MRVNRSKHKRTFTLQLDAANKGNPRSPLSDEDAFLDFSLNPFVHGVKVHLQKSQTPSKLLDRTKSDTKGEYFQNLAQLFPGSVANKNLQPGENKIKLSTNIGDFDLKSRLLAEQFRPKKRMSNSSNTSSNLKPFVAIPLEQFYYTKIERSPSKAAQERAQSNPRSFTANEDNNELEVMAQTPNCSQQKILVSPLSIVSSKKINIKKSLSSQKYESEAASPNYCTFHISQLQNRLLTRNFLEASSPTTSFNKDSKLKVRTLYTPKSRQLSPSNEKKFLRDGSPKVYSSTGTTMNIESKDYKNDSDRTPCNMSRKIIIPADGKYSELDFNFEYKNKSKSQERTYIQETAPSKDNDFVQETSGTTKRKYPFPKRSLSIQLFESKVKQYILDKTKKSETRSPFNLQLAFTKERMSHATSGVPQRDESLSNLSCTQRSNLDSMREKGLLLRVQVKKEKVKNMGVSEETFQTKIGKGEETASSFLQKSARRKADDVTTVRKNIPMEEIKINIKSTEEKTPQDTKNTIMNNDYFDNGEYHVEDVNDLINYSREKAKIIETYILQEAKDRARKGGEDRFAEEFARAQLVEVRGGSVCQGVLKGDEHRKDIVAEQEVQEVYASIKESKKKLVQVSITKEQLYTEQKERLEDPEICSGSQLTDRELEFIRSQYEEKSLENLQLDKIDKVLRRLKFFSKIDKNVRMNFYRNAQFLQKPRGCYVFRQGDIGDLMYVILRGAVNVKIPKRFRDGQIQEITITSLYDGSHFGELAIMGGKFSSKYLAKTNSGVKNLDETKDGSTGSSSNKDGKDTDADNSSQGRRTASIQCAEETYFVAISREMFHEILFLVMREDFALKTRIAQMISFFKNEDVISLMPFVNNLKLNRYKIDQKVIERGDVIMDFYLLVKGKCNVVYETEDESMFKVSQIVRRNEEKRPGKKISQIVFKQLTPGDYFGFRPLLNPEVDNKYKENQISRAKLSIIVDSQEVEMYTFCRTNLSLLPERLKNILLNGVSGLPDFDDYDIPKWVQEHKDLRKYQKNLIKRVIN